MREASRRNVMRCPIMVTPSSMRWLSVSECTMSPTILWCANDLACSPSPSLSSHLPTSSLVHSETLFSASTGAPLSSSFWKPPLAPCMAPWWDDFLKSEAGIWCVKEFAAKEAPSALNRRGLQMFGVLKGTHSEIKNKQSYRQTHRQGKHPNPIHLILSFLDLRHDRPPEDRFTITITVRSPSTRAPGCPARSRA